MPEKVSSHTEVVQWVNSTTGMPLIRQTQQLLDKYMPIASNMRCLSSNAKKEISKVTLLINQFIDFSAHIFDTKVSLRTITSTWSEMQELFHGHESSL